MPMVRIGEALIALGFINDGAAREALSQQREDRSVPLGELLVRSGLVSRADLQTALARKMGYPLVDVTQFAAEAEALARLPYAVASRLPALPLMLRAGRLVVAVEDPSRPEALDEIEFAAQMQGGAGAGARRPAARCHRQGLRAHRRQRWARAARPRRRPSSMPRTRASCWRRWRCSRHRTAPSATRRPSSSPTTRWCG